MKKPRPATDAEWQKFIEQGWKEVDPPGSRHKVIEVRPSEHTLAQAAYNEAHADCHHQV